MSYLIHPGSDNSFFGSPSDQLAMGGELFIPLNGGSETQREVREYWRDYARARNLGFEGNGWSVRLTGAPKIDWLGQLVSQHQLRKRERGKSDRLFDEMIRRGKEIAERGR